MDSTLPNGFVSMHHSTHVSSGFLHLFLCCFETPVGLLMVVLTLFVTVPRGESSHLR